MPRVDVTLRGTPPVATPITVLPATISRAVSIPAPTISVGVKVTPAAVAAVASQPFTTAVTPSRDDLDIEVDQPNAFTTGLLSSYNLTNYPVYTGASTITTAGATIEGKTIATNLDIRAANVTVKNCYIIGLTTTPTSGRPLIKCEQASCVNFTVIDSEFFPTVVNAKVDGIMGHDYTVKRCKMHDLVDMFRVHWVSSIGAPSSLVKVIIEQNLCYDHLWWPEPGQSDGQTHNDGVQIEGGDGTNSRIRGNVFNGRRYSARSDPGLPDRGTGTEDNGRYAQGALAGIQYTTNGTLNSPSGYTRFCTDLDVLGNWILGYERGINAGSAVSTDVGRWWRNKFDDAQGERSGGSLSAAAGYTITMDPTTTCDSGDGTADANVYMAGLAGITAGTEVTVRRNQ